MFDDIFNTLTFELRSPEDPLTLGVGELAHHEHYDLWSQSGPGHTGFEDVAGLQHVWDAHPIHTDPYNPLSVSPDRHPETHAHADYPSNANQPVSPDRHSLYETQHGHLTPVTHDPATHAARLEDVGGQIVPHYTYWNPADFHGIGHPLTYSHYWQHQTGEDCAVMAQGEIFESLTGQHLTEQQLCQIAQAHSLYDPETGTQRQDVGKLLNLLGIQTEQKDHASLYDLANALQHNDRVIVGLNANEIWYPGRDSVTGAPVKEPLAGHAVWVTGIDQAPDGSVKVILCDSGIPNGRLEAIDVQDFLNAWTDYDDEMVVAHQPA